jgi:hypothetical protein
MSQASPRHAGRAANPQEMAAMAWTLMRWAWLPVAASLLAAAPAAAEETEPLLEDPVGVLGVAPTPLGGFTLTLAALYDRARNGANRDTWSGGLEAEAGVFRGADLRFSQLVGYGAAAPYPADPDTRVWGGASRLGLRWQLLEQDGLVPAVGVFGAVTTAYGETSIPSQSGELNLLVASTVLDGPRPVALYLNAGVSTLFEPQPGERPNRYQFAAGIAHSLAQDTSVALSYALNQQDRGERDQNLVALGLWHRLGGSGPILGAAVGAGIGNDSPAFFAGLSAKWVFGGQ